MKKAANWYRLAAAQGFASAQHNLASLYYQGRGILQNYGEAIKLYRLAAEQGHLGAANNLGLMYKEGKGVPQNYPEAIKWYGLAAKQGNAFAQSNLGTMFLISSDSIDFVKAYMWYAIGASNNSEIARKNRDRLAEEMTPADISKAQAMARECMNSGYAKCGY